MSDKVIVFDLGKVIFDYDLNIIAKALSKFSSETNLFNDMESFMSSNADLFVKYEKGLISSIDFYNQIAGLLSLTNLSFEKFSDIWNDIFTPNQEVVDLIVSLSYRYELALLSNTNELHFNFLYKKYPDFFMNFKKLHLSYLMNLRKPDTDIYNQVIKCHNVEPCNMFFTDDNQENVYSAMIVGIKAYSFKNVSKLVQDLNSFGIEI